MIPSALNPVGSRRRLWRLAWLPALIPALLLLALLATTAIAAGTNLVNRKISGTLPPGSRVLNQVMSPDGAWVVFSAYADAVDLTEALFATPTDGSQPPHQLNAPLPSGEYFDDFAISPDSSRVVYLTSRTNNDIQLYSAPIDGSSPAVPLVDALDSWEIIQDFAISPDSSRVVYLGDLETDTVNELYTVPIGGGPAVKVRSTASTGAVFSYEVTPDASRIVYRADQNATGLVELYVVPIDGSSLPLKLNGPLIIGGDVLSFTISPDSSRVVYRADQLVDGVFELGSVPLDGSSPAVRLNGPLVSGGSVDYRPLISPDSSRVLYRADQHTDGVFELFSVRLAGGGRVKLNGPLVSGGDVGFSFQFSPDSSRVLYAADQDTDGVTELYSVQPNGAGRVKLNSSLVGNAVSPAGVSPDSSRVVYMGDQDTDGVNELYSVPLDGSDLPVKLNGPLVPDGDAGSFATFSADSSRVVYMADQDTDGVNELYGAPALGGAAPVRLNGPLVSGGDVRGDFLISPDSNHVVYVADQETDGIYEIFVTSEELPEVSFSAPAAAVPEAAGLVTATVQLSFASSVTVEVDYAATGGTASGGGVDYTLDAGTLSFAPGATTATIAISITGDLTVEPDETIDISLSNPQNALPGSPDTLTVTILDDDSAGPPAPYSLYLPLARRE